MNKPRLKIDNVEHLEYKGKKFRFPQLLLSLISIAKRRAELNLDNVWLITGAVGSGKSTLAKGIAGVYEMMFNRDLSIDNFTWSSEGLISFTDKRENETKVIVQDEGIVGMTGRDSITKSGHQLKITLVTKRRMKIFYIILIDELQEYNQKIINRATLLIDTRFVMSNGDPQRGYFKIYSQKELKEVYMLLKDKKIKSIQQYCGKHKPFFRFSNYENIFLDEEEYENKKIEETKQDEMKNGKVIWDTTKIQAYGLWFKGGFKQVDIAEKLNKSPSTINDWIRDFKKFAFEI